MGCVVIVGAVEADFFLNGHHIAHGFCFVLCPLSHRVHENTGCEVFQQAGVERSQLELEGDAGEAGEVGEKLGTVCRW